MPSGLLVRAGAPTAADVIGSVRERPAPSQLEQHRRRRDRPLPRLLCRREPGRSGPDLRHADVGGGGGPQARPDCEGVSLSADGLTAFFASSGGDDRGVATPMRRSTSSRSTSTATTTACRWDGKPTFRLNDADPADASLDPDSDGVTNREEFAAGTNPRGLFKYYLAEGAQNAFFNTEIAVFKPATTSTDRAASSRSSSARTDGGPPARS